MTKRDVSLSLIALALTLVCLSAFSPRKCFGQIQPESEREKAHLHFDKPSYIAGDTIWFKAYVVMAGGNTPTRWPDRKNDIYLFS